MDHKSNTLSVVYIRTSELKANENNPRKHSKEALEQLKRSINEHSMVDPIIINSSPKRKGVIIGGEMRWKACKELGHETIPCIELKITDIEKEKALCLRLNAVSGEWNEEMLKSFDENFLLSVGFEPDDLEDIHADVMDSENDDFLVEKELAEAKVPISKFGDLYQLGSHRLICGDSTNLDTINKLVGNEKIDLIYLDPPYNIKLNYNSGISGTKNYGGSERDNKTDSEYESFLKSVFENALAVSKKDVHMFCYSDQKYASLVQRLHEDLGLTFKRTCLWLKLVSNPTPQIAFSKIYEPVTYSVRGKPYLNKKYTNFNEILNKEFSNGHRVIDEFYDMIDIWAVKKLSGNLMEHATEKPVVLHDKPFKRCTEIGSNILSLFGGSGGEMICAEQLKRRVFMVEKDPIFIDLIIKRYENFTGEKAIKLN